MPYANLDQKRAVQRERAKALFHKWRSEGRCTDCGKKLAPHDRRWRCDRHEARRRVAAAKRRARKRQAVTPARRTRETAKFLELVRNPPEFRHGSYE
jgi:hypothetical protein